MWSQVNQGRTGFAAALVPEAPSTATKTIRAAPMVARATAREFYAALSAYHPGVRSFPVTRLRRFRRTASLRGLVRETRLSLDQFVMPLFVAPEPLANE